MGVVGEMCQEMLEKDTSLQRGKTTQEIVVIGDIE